MYGGVNAMAGTVPSVAFNVGIALVAGLAASVTASFVVFLGRRDGAREKVSLVAGGASAVLLLLMSNLAGLWTLLDITRIAPSSLLNWYHGKEYDRVDNIVTWRPDDFWWWWKSSRITNSFNAEGGDLDFTIQEYPFFSILLGDFHPHLMSIPFVLTGITVLTALFIANRSISFSALRKNIPATVIAVIAIGSSGFINFWDVGLLLLLSAGLVVVAWIAKGKFGVRPLIAAALPIAALWALGVLVYSPFYFGTAESQVQWPPLAPVKYGSRPIHFISIWLLLMTMAAPVALLLASKYSARIATRVRGKMPRSQTERNLIWRPAWVTGVALVVIPWMIWVVTHIIFNDNALIIDVITRLPVTGVLGVFSATMIAVVLTRARRGADDGAHFVLILCALAVYLLFAAELFFVHDLFSNRMNTVFKFYYQAWIVLSVVGGYGAFVWWKYHPKLVGVAKWGSRTAIGIMTVVIISSFYFPVASAVSKTVASGLGPDLDGLSFMKARDEDELNVIRDISKISEHDDVLVEAVGGSYSEYSRISGSTGVPTPLGWEFHEKQWHGNTDLFFDRKSDVETLYTTDDKSEIYEIIAKYSLTMVVVGPRERSTYGNIDMTMFDTIGDRIIEHGFYTVFSIKK
jgi:YYY domain-containing protein